MIRKLMKFCGIIILFIVCMSSSSVSIPSLEAKISNDNDDKIIDVHAMSMKIAEIQKNDLYTALDVYSGDLTGYAANCPLCGGTLGCTGQNVLDGTVEYNDEMYGTVRIVASSKSLPCGSIIRFNLSSLSSEPVIAIVLDRGVLGKDLDLLVESEDYAISTVGRRTISYDILRFGYTRE